MVDTTPTAARTPAAHSDSTLLTYRYLRAGIIAVALLLCTSVVLEMSSKQWAVCGSISSYVHSPVRSVFVGALVAIGVCLVAIRGGKVEETLLNLAGMFAPVVALVPTRLKPSPTALCNGGLTPPSAEEVRAGIENNMTALVIVGLLCLAFAWFTIRTSTERSAEMRIGLGVASAVWAVFGLWLWISWGTFYAWAHNTAAILMFGCIVAVVVINARRVRARDDERLVGLTSTAFQRAYWIIAGGMLGTLVIAVAIIARAAQDITPPSIWIFTVESVLLILFTAFWILQSMEYWKDGIPDQDRAENRAVDPA